MAVYLVVIFLIIVSLYLLPLSFDTFFYSPSADSTLDCLYVSQWSFSIAMNPPEHCAHDTRQWKFLLQMAAAFLLPWKIPFPSPVLSVFPYGAVFYACGL